MRVYVSGDVRNNRRHNNHPSLPPLLRWRSCTASSGTVRRFQSPHKSSPDTFFFLRRHRKSHSQSSASCREKPTLTSLLFNLDVETCTVRNAHAVTHLRGIVSHTDIQQAARGNESRDAVSGGPQKDGRGSRAASHPGKDIKPHAGPAHNCVGCIM